MRIWDPQFVVLDCEHIARNRLFDPLKGVT